MFIVVSGLSLKYIGILHLWCDKIRTFTYINTLLTRDHGYVEMNEKNHLGHRASISYMHVCVHQFHNICICIWMHWKTLEIIKSVLETWDIWKIHTFWMILHCISTVAICDLRDPFDLSDYYYITIPGRSMMAAFFSSSSFLFTLSWCDFIQWIRDLAGVKKKRTTAV